MKNTLTIIGILLIIYILYLWMQHNKMYKSNGTTNGQATLGPGYQIYPPVVEPVIYMPNENPDGGLTMPAQQPK